MKDEITKWIINLKNEEKKLFTFNKKINFKI